MASFWLLSIVLLLLRQGGNQLGWGFQLQEPAFVFALSALLLSFALSLSGVFEFGMSAIGVGQNLTRKSGLSGSFFSGVLATLVATPCSAPFLAPALGAALALDPLPSFLLFNAVGLGLASPYLLLCLFPEWLRVLPKPGAWMESFKQIMAFPLYATVAYLSWTLLGQLDEPQQLNYLLSMVMLAFSWWIWGRWGAIHHSTRQRRLAKIGLIAGITLAGLAGFPQKPKTLWQDWSPEILQQHLQDGNNVYVDFTARWCATCQVNKRNVFSDPEVLRRFSSGEWVALRADWTLRDERITRELQRHGRAAVPFNLIYHKGSPSPVVLPEILTASIVLKAMDQKPSE
jgi:thiol:disulfide interchange protein DsbD